jgi:hypothetical protein
LISIIGHLTWKCSHSMFHFRLWTWAAAALLAWASYKWAFMSTVWAHAELTYECMKMPVLVPKGLVLARFGRGIAFTSASHFTPNGYNSWIILDLLASMYVINSSVLSFHKFSVDAGDFI